MGTLEETVFARRLRNIQRAYGCCLSWFAVIFCLLAPSLFLLSSSPASALNCATVGTGCIANEVKLTYPGADANAFGSCTFCHTNGGQRRSTGGTFTNYGIALAEALSLDPNASGYSPSSQTRAQIQAAIRAIEETFAPTVSRVEALNSGGGVIETFTSNLSSTLTVTGEAVNLRVTFSPGRDPLSSTTTVTSSVTSPRQDSSSKFSTSGTVNTFTVSIPSKMTRGADRRAGQMPYALDYDPINTDGIFHSFTPPSENTLRISFSNLAPTAVDDSFVAAQDNDGANPLALDVLNQGKDTDEDSTGAEFTVAIENALPASDGTVTLATDQRSFLYQIPASLDPTARDVTFAYRVSDNESSALSSTATVTIKIPAAAPSVQPDAQDDRFVTLEDTALTAQDVKADNGNGADSDADTDIADLTFSVIRQPSSGDLDFQTDGTFTYTPALNDTGDADNEVDFEYQVSDGALTDTATVTIEITPQNDAPEAVTIAETQVNELQADFVRDLLDATFVNDPDGDALTVSDVTLNISSPVSIDSATTFSVAGSALTIKPGAFAELDNDQSADLTFTYTISDPDAATTQNTLTITITGIDNGLGRQAGAYADTLSSRYNNHFLGQNLANASCHSCHLVGRVGVDVDSRDQCEQTPPVFNPFGLQICLNRDPDAEALSDLVRRLREAEAEYAPQLTSTATLFVEESAAINTEVGDPLTASPGRKVTGAPSQIVTYLFGNDSSAPPSSTDPTGQFKIDDSGQIRVASASVAAGTYNLIVLPVNDAGQLDREGNERSGIPGFFPVENGGIVTVQVLGENPQVVDDIVNLEEGQTEIINVLANDSGGGTATSVRLINTPSNGTAIINSDLTVSYSPNAGFTGSDSFTYVGENASGTSPTNATVSITVLAAGSVIAVDDRINVALGKTASVDVLANDRNADDTTVVTLLSTPNATTQGTASVVGQSINFVPVADFEDTVLITYRAENASGNGSSAVLSISASALGTGAISNATDDPELKKVATAFEESCLLVDGSGDGADFLNVCAALETAASNGEDLTGALNALRNEEHLAAFNVTDTMARGIGRTLSKRLSRLRSGNVRGFDFGGLSLTAGGEQFPVDILAAMASSVLNIREPGWTDPNQLVPDSPWRGFIAGEISISEKDPETNATGFDVTATDLSIGIDYQYADGPAIGVAFGYSQSQTDFSDGGSLDGEGFQVSLYGIRPDFLAPEITLEGQVSVGTISFDSNRRISFTAGGSTVDAIATANYDARYINIAPRLSYTRSLEVEGADPSAFTTGLELTWFAGLDFLHVDIDGYTESGGGGLALTTQSSDYESLLLSAGAELSRPIFLGANVLAEAYGSFSVSGELLNNSRSVTSSFAVAGPSAPTFVVTEDPITGLGGRLEIGTRIAFARGETDISIAHEFGRGGVRTNSLRVEYGQSIFGNDRLAIGLGATDRNSGTQPWRGALEYEMNF